jgi:hypothetical protein
MTEVKPQVIDKTFRVYDAKQGQNYHEVRRDYHASVYQSILDFHTTTGGQFDTLLDVGCGTFFVFTQLLLRFKSTDHRYPAPCTNPARSLTRSYPRCFSASGDVFRLT